MCEPASEPDADASIEIQKPEIPALAQVLALMQGLEPAALAQVQAHAAELIKAKGQSELDKAFGEAG